MMTFLFWNINRKPLLDSITWLVNHHNIDVLILAESEIKEVDILKSLNVPGQAYFSKMPPGLPSRITLYSRFPNSFIKPIEDDRGISIRHIKQPIGLDLILTAVHMPSKLNLKESDHFAESMRLAQKIEKVENNIGHTRTLIIGDLNMNPFETGVVAADGIHAISDRQIAARGTRVVGTIPRRFFYNPMWNYFGDEPPGPPGTYFYDGGGKQVSLYWHILDQVLIRPELLNTFSDENLKIITEIDSKSLLSNSGRPDREFGSDHLPILLSLTL